MAATRDSSNQTPVAQWVMWALGIVASIFFGLAGSSYTAGKENEHRVTQVEAETADLRRAVSDQKAAYDASLRQMELAHAQEREEFRRLLSDVREDVAAIRGALRIPKN